jgi:hypothetical protein
MDGRLLCRIGCGGGSGFLALLSLRHEREDYEAVITTAAAWPVLD